MFLGGNAGGTNYNSGQWYGAGGGWAALVLSVVMVQSQMVVMVVMEHRFQQPSEIQQDQVLLETLID